MLRDTHLDRQCLHRLNSSLRSLFPAHAILVHIHCLGDIYIFGQSSRSIELHDDRQQQCISHTVRNIEDSSQRMSHTVNHAQAYIRERHTCNVLCHGHTVTGFRIGRLEDSGFQITGNHFDRLDLEHIAHFPSAFGYQPFDGVGQCVQTGRSSQPFRQSVHQFRIHNSDGGNIVRVYTNHLLMVFLIRDDIVDSHLGGSTGGSGQCNDRH